jgi:glutamate 5-kinase
VIEEVFEITDDLRALAGGSATGQGTGGMRSKVAAAELSLGAGVPLIIASGSEAKVLKRLVAGERIGTRFSPPADRLDRRRHWIGSLSKVMGTLVVDSGAARALQERGSSLLAIGVRAVEGTFERGDALRVVDLERRAIGRGLVGYASADVEKILGQRSPKVLETLGVSTAGPVVHRDDFALSGSP